MTAKETFLLVLSVALLLPSLCGAASIDGVLKGSIVQVSRTNKDSVVRMLKASLTSCREHHSGTSCKPKLEIQAWLDPGADHETFLVIDEVHDARKRVNLKLMDPYLVQVSIGERKLLYPLMLNQIVEVTCEDGSVGRRNVDSAALEPTDDGDNPNLLVQRQILGNSQSRGNFSRKSLQHPPRIRAKRFFHPAKRTKLQARFAKLNTRNSRVENPLKRYGKSRRSGIESSSKPIKKLSFSIYTLALPLHQSPTRVQVFRKSNNKWLRLHPEITFTSLPENFNDGDFQVSSSSRKRAASSLDFESATLIVPNNQTSHGGLYTLVNERRPVSTDEIKQAVCPSNATVIKRSLVKLQGSGMMPRHGDAITRCPINDDQICLNLRDDEAPTWKLDIRMPILHNEVIDPLASSAKISSIFIDTSDGGNLFVQLEITGMDHFTKAANLTFTGCASLQHLNISHALLLPPNKSVLVKLGLPLPLYAAHKKETCEANILDERDKVIARREFILDPSGARCVCLWHCDCFCTGAFLTNEVNDLCHTMSTRNEIFAGFLEGMNYEEIEEEIGDEAESRKLLFILLSVSVLGFVLLLGIIKAILGCCFTRVGVWKFNYVHPCQTYRESSGCRRFIVNSLFFFMLPFAPCLCCWWPRYDKTIDSDTSIQGRRVVQQEIYSDDDSDNQDDEVRLLKPSSSSLDYGSAFKNSSETVFDVRSLKNPYEEHEKELEEDTNFVIQALNDSRTSLCKLESHHSIVNVTNDPRFEDAQTIVKDFLAARIVYRRFNSRIGNVKAHEQQHFSIRGYFMPSHGEGYQFMTYNPIRQVYEISNNNTLQPIAPQINLDSKAFRRFYANKIEVLTANDLSLRPSVSAPCINVLVQDHSMYAD